MKSHLWSVGRGQCVNFLCLCFSKLNFTSDMGFLTGFWVSSYCCIIGHMPEKGTWQKGRRWLLKQWFLTRGAWPPKSREASSETGRGGGCRTGGSNLDRPMLVNTLKKDEFVKRSLGKFVGGGGLIGANMSIGPMLTHRGLQEEGSALWWLKCTTLNLPFPRPLHSPHPPPHAPVRWCLDTST